jgi:hypothetical protein
MKCSFSKKAKLLSIWHRAVSAAQEQKFFSSFFQKITLVPSWHYRCAAPTGPAAGRLEIAGAVPFCGLAACALFASWRDWTRPKPWVVRVWSVVRVAGSLSIL